MKYDKKEEMIMDDIMNFESDLSRASNDGDEQFSNLLK